MNELNLFTGGGGGLLGTKLLGFNNIGYVEINDYCQRIIAQRIKDGFIDNAPIYGDIRTFIGDGYAASYKGLVDLLTAGFPCQPFSSAGLKLGEFDARNLWPETLESFSIIRPKLGLLENVANLLTHEYFGQILGDLAEIGYHVKHRFLSASELGAPHQRNRVWLLVVNTDALPNSDLRRCGQFDTATKPNRTRQPPRLSVEKWRNSWFGAEPNVGRVAYGVASRVDRLKALGNGQVPIVVKTVYELLNEMS